MASPRHREGSDTRVLDELLDRNPAPEQARAGLERLLDKHPATRSLLRDAPKLDAVLTLFAHSRFLADALMRHPEWLDWVFAVGALERTWSADELRTEAGALSSDSDDQTSQQITRYKQLHLLRIALRDLLGEADLAETTLDLSNLADALIESALAHVYRDLERRFGRPIAGAEPGALEDRFVVLALGKLGGRELNYSSDVDLLYLHTGTGRTSGPIRTSNADFEQQLARRLTQVLCATTAEGFAYRVDLRLRPEGGAGELVTTLAGAVDYYRTRARDWELQMLIKARPVAGDLRLGRRFLELVEAGIWETTTDFSQIERLSESRDRIEQNRRGRAPRRRDVKLDRGGIRDIEFLVQCLQRLYGGSDSFLRGGGTLLSLFRLHEKGYLSTPDYARLRSGYEFLRTIEHRLQLMDNRQTHELPTSTDAVAALERKLQTPSLEADLTRRLSEIAAIYERVVGSQAPTKTTPVDRDKSNFAERGRQRHFERTSPRFAEVLRDLQVDDSEKLFHDFLDQVVAEPDLAEALERQPELAACAGDLFRLSPYLGAHLTRYPADLLALSDIAGEARRGDADEEVRAKPLSDPSVDYREKSSLLRRIFRLRMFRLLADSVHRSRPIFTSLERSSGLADWVIQTAYRIAVEESERKAPRAVPELELQVIALGRLGMREFDLGSDADLVYILPNEAREDAAWWLGAVKLMTEIISSYTREGLIFAIDSRLRPGGRDGELIQSESAYQDYFSEHAEAWETLSYLKARPVAGDTARAKEILVTIQQIGWKRYGLSGDSAKLLDEMRGKLERELGGTTPLKAGRGGYYDIDFLLLYLRLRGAVVFFDYLSTPARIELVRQSGQITPPQAELLLKAATFYRGLDHAIRTATGQPSPDFPSSSTSESTLRELMARWGAAPAGRQSLRQQSAVMQQRTRAIYDDFFGRP